MNWQNYQKISQIVAVLPLTLVMVPTPSTVVRRQCFQESRGTTHHEKVALLGNMRLLFMTETDRFQENREIMLSQNQTLLIQIFANKMNLENGISHQLNRIPTLNLIQR